MRITIQSDRPLTIGESRLFDCHHYDLADCRCSGALLLKEVGIRQRLDSGASGSPEQAFFVGANGYLLAITATQWKIESRVRFGKGNRQVSSSQPIFGSFCNVAPQKCTIRMAATVPAAWRHGVTLNYGNMSH